MTEALTGTDPGEDDSPFPEGLDEDGKRELVVSNLHPSRKIDLSYLRQLVLHALRQEGLGYGQLNLVLLDAQEMRRYNRDFHSCDESTDHLGFQFDAPEGLVSGDIFVCLDDCAEQAPRFGSGLRREVAKVCLHGVLHLCGWKDDRPAARERMHRREEELLDGLAPQRPLVRWLKGSARA